ncbi:MAG TPA: THxN family PEP-CTERM protein [Stellaceae bacterium]|nr:THxN family PEP-CTERM protein [Stellaceae bacterium]
MAPSRNVRKRVSTLLTAAAGAIALAALTAAPAAAHTVDFSNIVGTWQNAVPPGVVTITGPGTADPKARWGIPDPSPGPQSGYNFDAAAGIVTAMVPPSPSDDFTLGTFTHVNEPIASGTSITGIQLAVTMDVSIDGNGQGSRTFLFDFTHDETPNGDTPCPYGGNDPSKPGGGPAPNGVGVNDNGCADRVTVNVDTATSTFMIGGDTYTVNIEGFKVGSDFATDFLTEEQNMDSAQLQANVTLASTVIPGAPEPASLAVLGVGLAGLGILRRRKSRR